MALMSGLNVTWTDTQGASNVKWTDSESKLEAHVEAPELGTHTITISDQPTCTVTGGGVSNGGPAVTGPGNITIDVKPNTALTSWHISVFCN